MKLEAGYPSTQKKKPKKRKTKKKEPFGIQVDDSQNLEAKKKCYPIVGATAE
jgi:hypothetical protein